VGLALGLPYDANGNVTSLTPPGRPAHTFSYTPVDLESNYTPPDAGFSPRNTQYTYNLDKQLTLVTRPDVQTMTLAYDAGGRLSTLTLPGSQTIAYAYSGTTGNLSMITAPGSTLAYTYDGSLLTQSTWSGTVAGSVSRTYDNNFRITSQSVNGANTVAFGYDNDSLLTSAGAETITRRADNGLISGTTLGTVTDSRTYNPFGELSSSTANVSGSPVFSVTYTRDKLGRITQKVETVSGTADTFDYTYDQAGRLQQVKKNGTVIASYLYDSNGNRLSRTTPGGTTLGFYDAQDRLTQYASTTYGYTANGELQSSTVSGQTTTYQYDVLGNLKSVVGPTGFTVEYLVDAQNRRIGKKVNGTLGQAFLYQNQLNPVAELDGTGAIVSRFVYGTKANVPDYVVKGGVTYRIISDHLGSPRLVINAADGTVAQRLDYDEFGNVTLDTNPGFQPFGFAGGLADQHTGLVRFGLRDYDAVPGRWTAKDPIAFAGGSGNLFGYVLNDPISLIDPSGLDPCNVSTRCKGPTASSYCDDIKVSVTPKSPDTVEVEIELTKGVPSLSTGAIYRNPVGGYLPTSDNRSARPNQTAIGIGSYEASPGKPSRQILDASVGEYVQVFVDKTYSDIPAREGMSSETGGGGMVEVRVECCP